MRSRGSSIASSLGDAQSSSTASKAKAIPRNRSRGSINLDTCSSPDFNSVALEKELTDVTDSDNQAHAHSGIVACA